MTNSKTTKRALLTSVMALVLCFAMLTGTTFAWFTDTETSSGNKIVAGNLNVDLLMYTADQNTDDGYSSIAKSTKPIFGEGSIAQDNNAETLWEPGKTQVAFLAIRNIGNLALKYNVIVDVTDNGLIGALEYAIVPVKADANTDLSTYTWETIKNQASDKGDLAAGKTIAAPKGCLDEIKGGVQNETDYFALAIHMKEEAGNEYKEKSVVIDITVNATQVEAEADSFGPNYDEGLNVPDENGNILVEKDNVQFVYTPEGDSVLYLVTADYAEDTVSVPNGIKTIGNYAFAYNPNVKTVILSPSVTSLGQGFNSSTVETVVLNEGLEQIDSRAFRATTTLKEVEISSTVKTIADDAFQKTGLTSITIPANVEYIGAQAFGASLIETVIIEGTPTIQNKAFRGCANLRTVHLNGDDITFENTTGQANCWFCNSESNNSNTSNITFYVKNANVAEKVKAAMGAEANNTTIYINQ